MIHNPPLTDLESIVFAFEHRYASEGSARISDFAPPRSHPEYDDVVTELIRVDLERRRQHGDVGSLEDYGREFEAVFASPERLRQLAFEDYRLRRQAGEDIRPEAYATRYGVDTSCWLLDTTVDDRPTETPGNSRSGTLDSFPGDAVRLADFVQWLPSVGTKFGEFELIDELGDGSFGRVYLARQTGLANRHVVLKVSAHLWGESQRLANLQHTNIVPVYSVHHAEDLQAVCMPYLGRDTLAGILKRLKSQSKIPGSGRDFIHAMEVHQEEAEGPAAHGDASQRQQLTHLTYVQLCLQLASQLADGLAHAHQRGIVHRDLKPENVLACRDGRAMILDFNLSDEIVSGGRSALLVGGTLPYMAPEHLRAVETGARLGPQSDVYSLGVILFELLTLQQPFPLRHGSLRTVIQHMLSDRQGLLPSARAINPAVTPAVDSILATCLAADPQRRYQSAEHVLEDLRRQLSDRPLRHAANPSRRERCEKWCRRHPRVASGTSVLAACAVVILVLGTSLVIRGRKVDELAARQKLAAFAAAVPRVQASLTTPDMEPSILRDAVSIAERELRQYLPRPDKAWRRQREVRLLDTAGQTQLAEDLAELAYLTANAYLRLSRETMAGEANVEPLEAALHANELAAIAYGAENAVPIVWKQRRKVLLRLGRDADADTLPAPARAAEATGGTSRFLEGVALLQAGRFSAAEGVFTALRSERPLDIAVWMALANAKVGQGQLSAADECFSASVALAPDSYVPFFFRGLCRLQQGRLAAAVGDFDRVLELKPGLPAALVNRAVVRSRLGSLADAEADLTQALSNGATETRIYFLRSRLRERRGDHAGAATDHEEGLRRTPQDVNSWLARGVAQLSENPARALADFRQAYLMDPGSRDAAQNIVHVLSEQLGELDKAVEMFGELIAQYPADLDLRAGRAVLLARQGQRKLALADAAAILAQTPRPMQLYQVACVYALLSNEARAQEQAMDLLQQAIQRELKWGRVAATDPDLDTLRGQARFQSLLTAVRTIDTGDPPPENGGTD